MKEMSDRDGEFETKSSLRAKTVSYHLKKDVSVAAMCQKLVKVKI